MASVRDKTVLSSGELTLARVLIASYFLAVSVGLAEGVSVAPLFQPLLGSGIASFLSHVILFAVGVLVLLGAVLRQVALTIAGLLIASHFMTFAVTGMVESGAIWRDIALVGALVMTYGQREGYFSRTVPVNTATTRREREEGGLLSMGGVRKSKIYASLDHLFNNDPVTGRLRSRGTTARKR